MKKKSVRTKKVQSAQSIKIVSFNIEFGARVTQGYWQYATNFWKYLLPHDSKVIGYISDIINTENADIVTFTEMDAAGYRTGNKDYMMMVSQQTPLKNNAFYPVNKTWFNLGNRGNAIATKYSITEMDNVKLKTTIEDRYLSVSKIKMGNTTVNVLTTQLSLGHADRLNQFAQIAEYINNIQGPVIFTGDLNTQHDDELKILNSTRLKRIETANTFPSWGPTRRIDYIFCSPEFQVMNCKVLDNIHASDHLPLVAELKLRK